MEILFTALIGLITLSCNQQARKIGFTNKSGLLVDSIKISVSSVTTYGVAFKNIKNEESVIANIPENAPEYYIKKDVPEFYQKSGTVRGKAVVYKIKTPYKLFIYKVL